MIGTSQGRRLALNAELEFHRMVAALEAGRPFAVASLISRFPELGDVAVDDVEIPGRHGPVAARFYRGQRTGGAGAGFVWVHGGGWIGGDLDLVEGQWPSLAIAAAGIPVLSVDYRKAVGPYRFPVPSDDVTDAWLWAGGHPGAFGPGTRALHLGGASAGANLVAGAALRLRDGQGPAPASVVLAYPLVHPELPPPSAELRAALLGAEVEFDEALVRAITSNYVPTSAGLADPYAFPGLGDASGLPPTLILNSEVDALRASGDAYGAQIAEAGGVVRVVAEPGARHGHLNRPEAPEAHRSLATILKWLSAEPAEPPDGAG